MNKKAITTFKRLPIYPIYRKAVLRKRYADKIGKPVSSVLFNTKVVKNDLEKILLHTKIQNIGVGNFFYSIDTSLIIDNRGQIIDNMPVDYGFVISQQHYKERIPQIIQKYIDRINDKRVRLGRPANLEEALQAILFWNSLLWQTGHTLVGLGRIDKILAQYEVPPNAEDLICDFLKTLHCCYDFKSSALKGDTGQIIILGGLNQDGTYFCNDYTYLFIKCLRKINLPDPKILLRCSSKMPIDLMTMAVDCVSTGIGSPLFSNDDVVVPNLIDFGYEDSDAYNYAVSACWEPLSIGNSLEQNNLVNIEFGRCMHETIVSSDFAMCLSIEDVVNVFFGILHRHCEWIKTKLDSIEWAHDPLLSYMMGLKSDISQGGAKYNNYGILSVGLSAAVDSLLNIEKYVFDQKKYTLRQIQDIIIRNYPDGTKEFAINESGFGTDSERAIWLSNSIINKTEKEFCNYRNKFGGKVKFGLSSPGYISFSNYVGATLDGRMAGQPFNTHISRDKGEPITELMNFESKLAFSGVSSNANVLDVVVQPTLIRDNISKFAVCILGGIKAGIFQLQLNVLSYLQLVDAKEHPEKYPNLIVRVWGFSAYFNDLPEEYKENLIRRAKELEGI